MKEKKLVDNIVFYTIKQICAIVFPMIVYPYVTRTLGVENLGKVEYAKSIVQYFVLLGSLGITDYAIREGARLRDDSVQMNRFATQILTIHAVSTVTAMFGLLCLASSAKFFEYRSLLLTFMLIIPFNFIGTEWMLGIHENYKYISIRTMVIQIVSFGLTFASIHTPDDYVKYSCILVLSTAGASILNVPLAHKYFELDFSQFEIIKHLKSIVLIFGMAVAGGLYTNMDTSMLGLMTGTISVGYYAAANKLVNLIATFVGAVRTVLLPRLSYSVGIGDENTFKKINSNTLQVILMFSIPIAGGILCLSEDIIRLFCGESFLPGALALRLLVPEIVLSAINGYIVYQILLPLKKEKNAFLCIAMGALSNLCVNAILIPLIQQNGAAIATCISEFIVFSMANILSSKCILESVDTQMIFKAVFKYGVAGIIMTVCCFMAAHFISNMVLRIMVTILIGVIVYFSALMVMKETLSTMVFQKILRK